MPLTRLSLALVCVALSARAAAPSKVECVKASDAGQLARDELRFTDARAQLQRCADAACPAVVRADCANWLAQLDAAQPSVVFAVRVGSTDLADGYEVSIDGRAIALPRPGEPLRLDPGAREITVRLRDARSRAQKVVIVAGEKNRKLEFGFTALEPSAAVVEPPKVVEAPVERPSAVVPVLLTGGAAVGGGLFALLGVLGNQAAAPVLTSPCAATKTCNPDDLASARGLYLAADLALGVGVAFAATAIWRWIAWATYSPSNVTSSKSSARGLGDASSQLRPTLKSATLGTAEQAPW